MLLSNRAKLLGYAVLHLLPPKSYALLASLTAAGCAYLVFCRAVLCAVLCLRRCGAPFSAIASHETVHISCIRPDCEWKMHMSFNQFASHCATNIQYLDEAMRLRCIAFDESAKLPHHVTCADHAIRLTLQISRPLRRGSFCAQFTLGGSIFRQFSISFAAIKRINARIPAECVERF